jgi:hypothetical protein
MESRYGERRDAKSPGWTETLGDVGSIEDVLAFVCMSLYTG